MNDDQNFQPVTFDRCTHINGPFFHGTKVALEAGDLITSGNRSNYQNERISRHVYFSALVEPAVWGAELAVGLGGGSEAGRVYRVEPTGPFEDDPNVTNKRFPGNPTQSYRSREPLRVVDELQDWQGHAPEVLQAMLDNVTRLLQQGLDVIED